MCQALFSGAENPRGLGGSVSLKDHPVSWRDTPGNDSLLSRAESEGGLKSKMLWAGDEKIIDLKRNDVF